MKSSLEFSKKNPFKTALIIFFTTFIFLSFDAFDNPSRTKDWINYFIVAYSLIGAFSFLIFFYLILKVKYTYEWTLKKDILSLAIIFLIILGLILLFNFSFIRIVDSSYKDTFVYDGRLYIYLVFVGLVNFTVIKFLDFYFFYITKTKYKNSEKLILEGKNKYEKLILDVEDFVMIEAFGNYVLVYFINHNGELEKTVLRNSFSLLCDNLIEISTLKRVHSSYLINITKIISIENKNENNTLVIKHIDNPIPVTKSEVEFIQIYIDNNYNLPFHSL